MKKYKKMYTLRKKKGYTLKTLADKLNVSKQYIWDIEDGRRTLSYKMAFKISSILGMTPDEVFFEDQKRK